MSEVVKGNKILAADFGPKPKSGTKLGLSGYCQELPPRTGLSAYDAERWALGRVHEGHVG